ncbi:MAG: hypothetical protein QXR34_08395 [Saccharolobus sp.]
MITLKIGAKKEKSDNKDSGNKDKVSLIDLSQLPEEYLRNEFPEEWRALQKTKKYTVTLWYS